MYAAHTNNSNLKRQLLNWIIGLSSFNILLLLLIVILIFSAPALVRRCTQWQSKRKMKRRARLLQQFNLVERTALSRVKPSYDDLLKQISELKQKPEQLPKDQPTMNVSTISHSKIF